MATGSRWMTRIRCPASGHGPSTPGLDVLARCLQRRRQRGRTSMYNVMITVLELAAGVGLAGALVTVLAILVALELGRLVSRDDEQREVTTAAVDEPRCRAAA